MIAGKLLILVVMIMLTAFFVAAEFGLVKIRKSRLEGLAQSGDKKAQLGLEIVGHLDEYLSACQLGITLTSLAIGWLGEGTVRELLHPLLGFLPIPTAVLQVISLVISFLLITFVHVVIGELIPKSLSITKTEPVVLWVVTPLHYFYKATYPFIWLLNSSATGIGKLFGLKLGEGEETHSEEELLLIANESLKHGEINKDEFDFLNNVFDFDELLAKEIMVTRLDMEAIPEEYTIAEALSFTIETGHSRFPVIRKTKDDIVGYITLQDLVKAYLANSEAAIVTLVNEPIIVFETIPVKTLLAEMQSSHKHFAILVDEYGGTSGMVTIEDILEEIVGDIQDEQDREEENIRPLTEQEFMVNGKTPLTEIEDFFHVDFPAEIESISLSGVITDTYKQAVRVGFRCVHEGLEMEVVEMDKVNITKIKIKDRKRVKAVAE
ncbi:hemolysin family protein [Vagococcus allomyrinae]|uniref:hemolysin family protein n=1 Tax=Vagococcus allomyrinae TaxID=2794353 RepID=UPI001FD7FBB1|nr:hemolysin family protein [Vagococcus allomyrinae]